MKPSESELQELWLFAYARTSMIEALEWLGMIGAMDLTDSMTDALLAAAVIAYGRPFTKSQITVKLRAVAFRECSPPPRLQATHDVLLTLRDKVIGHKDATPPAGHSDTPNQLVLAKTGGEFALSTVVVGALTNEARIEAIELCRHFIEYADEKCGSFLRRYQHEFASLGDGFYRLAIEGSASEWVFPVKRIQGGQS